MPSRLSLLSLDKTRPGFYDDPVFLEAEQKDKTLLEAYAGYVDGLVHDETYLERARSCVVRSAEFLYEKLLQDGRKGACIDMSQMLSRFLEQQGVWNYIVKGGTAIYPASHTRIEPRFHWLYDSEGDPKAAAPHAWLYAPPFRIVDLTLGRQENAGEEAYYLREPILAENARKDSPRIEEVFDPPIRAAYRRQLGRPISMKDLARIDPPLVADLRTRGTWQVDLTDVSVRYVGRAVTAPDQPFPKARGWLMSGKSRWDLWQEFEGGAA
jgi:hypothetical protein